MESKGRKYVVEKNKSIWTSIRHSIDGIKDAYEREYHMIMYGYTSIGVIVAGVIFQISYVEWLVCLMLIALVFALELMNTAIEAAVNMITTKDDKYAKLVKDTSSGAVFVMTVLSAVIGLIIFVPKIIELII